jgi:mRNA-degrading endonuclease RelE of RelBE toxin-antitoxin system
MSRTVVVQQTAIRALARIRSADKDAFDLARRAISELADQPRPDTAVAWGDSGIYRLHLAGMRIVHEVDDQASAVYIINAASTP